jgi:hypothetical protein
VHKIFRFSAWVDNIKRGKKEVYKRERTEKAIDRDKYDQYILYECMNKALLKPTKN